MEHVLNDKADQKLYAGSTSAVIWTAEKDFFVKTDWIAVAMFCLA